MIGSSLKQKILIWLALPLTAMIGINASFSYRNAVQAANEAYDRTLYVAARTIAEELALVDGQIELRGSQAIIYLFQNNIGSKYFYQVDDFLGQKIAGNPGLLLPDTEKSGVVNYFSLTSFSDAQIAIGQQNIPVRLATLKHALVDRSFSPGRAGNSGMITIKVAETLEARRNLIEHILRDLVISQLILLAIALLVMWMVVSLGLRPIQKLSNALSQRDATNLEALDKKNIPQELSPLIDSFNLYLSRLAHLLDLRKQFIANAAHQLKTPWAIIKTQIGLAKKESLTPSLAEIIQGLSKTANHSVRLTEQLLALTKVEHADQMQELKEFNLVDLTKQILIECYAQAEQKKISIALDSKVNQLTLLGSEVLMHECLNNLIDNAIAYCQEGAQIHILIEQGALSISDNGPGIPSQHQAKIFNRFYRGDRSDHHGSGLGLAIVLEIARLHQMTVSLESPYSKNGIDYESGTKVTLTLLDKKSTA